MFKAEHGMNHRVLADRKGRMGQVFANILPREKQYNLAMDSQYMGSKAGRGNKDKAKVLCQVIRVDNDVISEGEEQSRRGFGRNTAHFSLGQNKF